MRRSLIIALAGLIVIALLEWGVNNEIGRYQPGQQAKPYQSSAFGGPVLLGLRDGFAIAWEWVGRNDRELLVIFTVVLAIVTVFLATFTRGLMIYTRKLWGSTNDLVERSEASTQITERAYVKMSHIQPGITDIDRENRTFKVFMEIENFGRTPARVTSVVLNPIVISDGPLPEIPIYGTPQAMGAVKRAFLVTGDKFIVEQRGTAYTPEIERGEHTIYLVGYVDYIDVFGQRHRGGYGRVHRPPNTSQNLVFITQPGYNYDRAREQGEGNDWGETTAT